MDLTACSLIEGFCSQNENPIKSVQNNPTLGLFNTTTLDF
jgi:hypothetical protein